MKTSSILLIACSILLLSSCELIDPILNPVKDECILLKTSWSIPNDPAHEETEFTYNVAGKLIEVIKESYDLEPDPYISRWTMTYNNDLLDQISSFSKFYSDPEEKLGDYIFFYDGNLPDTIKYKPASTSSNPTFTVIEYSSGKLFRLTDYVFRPHNSQYNIYSTQIIEWIGDNISKITNTSSAGSSSTTEYEYDDKKTPLGHLGLAFTSYGSLTMLSQNNVTKITYTTSSISRITEKTYTYNSTDYPIQVIPMKDAHPTVYEYDCKQ